MKKHNIILSTILLLAPFFGLAQGLEGIVVERYYMTNQADADNASNEGAVSPLVVGSTVYRVYVDMAAGYKFSTLYGNAAHNLTVNTTTNFYNDPNYGVAVNPGSISQINIQRHTAMIDSWFATGGVCVGKAGVMKNDDSDGSLGNLNGVLANNPGGCVGLNITGAGSQDGFVTSTASTQVAPNTLGLGLGNAVISALDQTPGSSLTISNGSIAALGGVVGPTAANRVLIGQFTTDGVFTFALNVQIINISTNQAENYVASAPTGSEQTHPSLTRAANPAPVVSITAPSNNAVVSVGANVSITANASDNGSVSSVAFFVDGVLLSTDNAAPFSAVYVATPGAHVITAIASDNACNTRLSTAVNIIAGAANDGIANAVVIPGNSNWYPQCQNYNGDITNATNSSESTTASGPDTWYSFVANSTAVNIQMTSTAFDNAISLLRQTAPGVYTQVDYENVNPAVGGVERMNYDGLVIGDTYFVSCGAASGTTGGTFQVCIRQLLRSACNTNTTLPLNNCATFKATWTGASTYTYQFVTVGASVGGGSVTSTGSISLSNPTLNLVPGNTYNVIINATYNLVDGLNNPESIVVFGNNPSCANVAIAPNASIEVRASQRCSAPATLLRSSLMRTDPFVCGATNYTFEFTPVTGCADNTPTGIPFTVTNVSRILALNFSGTNTTPLNQTIQVQTYYQVRVRPNFGLGGVNQGTYGNPQIIFVGGTVLETNEALTENFDTQREMTGALATAEVYPNPSNGSTININIENVDAAQIGMEIIDMSGRLVYSNMFAIEGSLQTAIVFDQTLANGLYNVRFTAGEDVMTTRILVQK